MRYLLFTLCACIALTGPAWPGQKAPLPPRVQILLQKVRTVMEKADYAGAAALIKEAETGKGKNPRPCSHPLVCLALGNCHLMDSAYGPAEEAYTTALTLDPGFLDAQVNLAKVYADSSRYGKASPAFKAAYDLSDPKVPDYLYYAAVMALMDGKAENAAGLFETLFAAHPDKVTRAWKEGFAQALMTARLWEKAVPLVRELAEQGKGEEQVKWQEALLQIYLTIEDTRRAYAWASHLARRAPQVANWWKALVHIHLSRGQYEKALDNLIILGFTEPLTREEKKLLADLCLQLEIPARAAAAYEDLLDQGTGSDPHGASSLNQALVLNLIHALRQMGRGDRAMDLLRRYPADALSPELLMVKGDLLYEAEEYKAANETFCLAARRDCPGKGQAWLMAGYAAWQQNDLAASRTAFQQAARFKGHRKSALAAMAQLEKSSVALSSQHRSNPVSPLTSN